MWTFQISNFSASFPFWVLVGFMRTDKIIPRAHDKSLFIQDPITSAVCAICSESYPQISVISVICNYARDDCYESY